MIFYKTSSFGNDFIVIDAGDAADADLPVLVREICDRQRGVGADGLVVYRPQGQGARFAIYNRDGGAAELSGNGMAGLAAVLLQRRLARPPLTLQAAIGRRRVALTGRQGPLFLLDVEIGVPDFAASGFFPFLREPQGRRPLGGLREPQGRRPLGELSRARAGHSRDGAAKGQDSYRAAGVEFHPVSVGNPHAVVLCREMPAGDRLAALGRRLEGHPMFPRRVNVEFVAPAGAGRWRVFYYERGVGPTQASSTGSAAVFAVLRRLGLAGDEAALAAGDEAIHVRWRGGIHVRTRTQVVCRGEYFPRE
jgi:diaminopimelate epimerase